LPHLIQFPILAELSAAGDTGEPLVVSDPAGPVARCFSNLAAAVVQEVAKLRLQRKNNVRFDSELRALVVRLPSVPGAPVRPQDGDEEFLLNPAVVRRNDTSARSVDEWTGQRILEDKDIPDDIQPQDVQPLGNYAVQITWADGFSQVASFELLASLPRLHTAEVESRWLNNVMEEGIHLEEGTLIEG
jgi:DUF971 family protein